MVLSPAPASATELEELSAEAERTAAEYDAAVAERDRIAVEMEELSAQIAEQENSAERYRQKSDSAIVKLYKIQKEQDLLLEMWLGATSLSDAVNIWENYQTVYNRYVQDIKAAKDIQATLEASKLKLEEDRVQAELAVETTGTAMESATAARKKAQEEAEAKEAAERAEKQSNAAAYGVSASDINWDMSKEEFVEEWGVRIDNFLEGLPLGGYGRVFAEAAYNNGADPRFSPAISIIESGGGRICFADFNAWGWMARTDFTSYEESIPQHVAYLCSSIYGTNGYLTRSFASTYCPPNAEFWYQRVSEEMSKI